MSNRLELIASLINDGIGVADVGTDHGYLPLILAEGGYRGNIIATDINAGPLEKARNNIAAAGFENRIELVLCDGLEGCNEQRLDTIVIAGMGGDTITGILDKAEWCAKPNMSLILQPVTKSEILRYWLINNGFEINKEAHVKENGNLYQIICAKPGAYCRYSDAELFVGKYELIKDSACFHELIMSHIYRFESAVSGLTRTRRDGLEAWLEMIRGILSELRSYGV